ncbi:MAG: hypothetical protein HF975_04270 [ANME-2 cluster archaeon]|nr:hypothetical protein [ANME-2 cluster archaeon]
MYKPFRVATIEYKNIIPVAKTRFPWFHRNFSGISGWKLNFIQELENNSKLNMDKGTTKVLFKVFGYPVILDSSRKELWRLLRFINSTSSIRVGWLYWALAFVKFRVYYIPEPVKAQYKFLADSDNLRIILQQGMNTGNIEMIMDAMDIMLKLDYSNICIQSRVVSKSGDRIQYIVTYPKTRVIIESVNGIRNQVLAAKYHHILSTGDIEDKKRNLIHKDDMTPEQLEWLEEVD